MGHHAGAVIAEFRRRVGRIFQRHFVIELRIARVDDDIFPSAEIEQDRLLQPLIDDPLAVLLFGDARLAAVEQPDRGLEGVQQVAGDVLRGQSGALFKGRLDQGLQCLGVAHGYLSGR